MRFIGHACFCLYWCYCISQHDKGEDVLYIIRKEINVQEEAQYDPGPGYYPDEDSYDY